MIYLYKQQVDLSGLPQLMVELRTSDPELNVVVRGGSAGQYKHIIVRFDVLPDTLATSP